MLVIFLVNLTRSGQVFFTWLGTRAGVGWNQYDVDAFSAIYPET